MTQFVPVHGADASWSTGFRAAFALRRWLRHPRVVKTAN
jgi:hypothetical protein